MKAVALSSPVFQLTNPPCKSYHCLYLPHSTAHLILNSESTKRCWGDEVWSTLEKLIEATAHLKEKAQLDPRRILTFRGEKNKVSWCFLPVSKFIKHRERYLKLVLVAQSIWLPPLQNCHVVLRMNSCQAEPLRLTHGWCWTTSH